MAFQRVAVIGTGLIGASLGLALRRLPSPPKVMGFDLSRERAVRALRDKAVDRLAGSLEEAVADADLVLVSVPVRAMQRVFQELAPLVKPGVVVSDTGSTKREVLAWAEEHLPSGVAFVGGHPMAGRLSNGPSDAPYARFEQTVYCLTPSASAPPQAVEGVAKLVEAIGAVPYFLDPEEHDGLVAAVSHMPYVAASALMSSVASDPGWREMQVVAAGGFATATRLVEGEARIFADICLTNRRSIARHLTRLIEELERVRDEIERGDEGLAERFTRTQELRAAWLAGQAKS
ncbi:MAG: prephenate dehydrogenase [Chloroflexi bacterium]|nr:prephenate dehydrogenase [Chloroflexota bacterium]